MQMTIKSRGQNLTDAIREHIESRLFAALDQHENRIENVEVLVADENGPRGGIDQVCQVVVRLTNGMTLRHERRGIDLYANVSLAADKVKRRVGRQVAKLRENRKRA